MPDPVTATIGAIGGGASVIGGHQARKGAESAGRAQERAGLASIEAQEAAELRAAERLQPFEQIGLSAQDPLQNLLGIERPEVTQQRQALEAAIANIQQSGQASGPVFDELNRRLQALGPVPQAGAGLPQTPNALDPNALPASPQAFDPSAVQDNPIFDFLLSEGFRGIKEGGATGGRNVDRDLVRFAQGTAATLVPQLQQQQFGQQSQLRNQALGEQGTLFAQQGGLRDQARGEQQQQIANLQNLLGTGQASATNQAQGALNTGSNISNILGNIGTAQAQTALGKSQATQNLLGNLTGIGGLALGMRNQGGFGDAQVQGRPIDAFGLPQQGPTTFRGGF